MRIFVLSCVCLWLLAFGKTLMSDIRVIKDVPYNPSEDAHPRQLLDLYLPTRNHFPVVVYIHGGAWVGGDKQAYANIGTTLAEAGYGVAIINYRLSPEYTHPAHTQDGAMAIAWLVNHIQTYGGDPDRLFLTGHSAGGHMVSLLVLDDQYLSAVDVDLTIIKGVISYSGLYWIDDWIMGWAKNAFSDDEVERRNVSPIHLVENAVHKGYVPPFLMIAAEHDYPELLIEQREMSQTFDKHSVDYAVHIIPNRDHFGLVMRIGTPSDPTTTIITAWLNALSEVA